MAGKGDTPRPINKKKYNENFEGIQWVSRKNVEAKQVKKAKGKTVYTY